jgi:hypothetical protein
MGSNYDKARVLKDKKKIIAREKGDLKSIQTDWRPGFKNLP